MADFQQNFCPGILFGTQKQRSGLHSLDFKQNDLMEDNHIERLVNDYIDSTEASIAKPESSLFI